jgi:hypothetical protein
MTFANRTQTGRLTADDVGCACAAMTATGR